MSAIGNAIGMPYSLEQVSEGIPTDQLVRYLMDGVESVPVLINSPVVSVGLACFDEKAITFNGIDQFGNADSDASKLVGIQNAFSALFWVKTTSVENRRILAFGNANSGNDGFQIDYRATGNIRLRSDGNNNDTSFLVNDGFFHHIAITYDGTDLSFYNDGIFSSQVSVSVNTFTATTFKISSNFGGSAFFFDGTIDDIWVFDRVLMSPEITAIANNQCITNFLDFSIEENSQYIPLIF